MSSYTKEIESKANGLTHSLNDKLQNIGNSMEKGAKDVVKEVESKISKVSEVGMNLMKTTRYFVVKNPIKSVAIAMLVGMVADVGMRMLMSKK